MHAIGEPAEPEGFNMTPMIDVTFQLIIFFMLVTDMTNRQVERLRLPTITRGAPVEPALVVNVRKEGVVTIDGRVFFRPPLPGAAYDARRLEDLFAARAAVGRRRPVLIRADRSAGWQWVQLVMQTAAAHGEVTRVEFAAQLAFRSAGAGHRD